VAGAKYLILWGESLAGPRAARSRCPRAGASRGAGQPGGGPAGGRASRGAEAVLERQPVGGPAGARASRGQPGGGPAGARASNPEKRKRVSRSGWPKKESKNTKNDQKSKSAANS